MSFQPRSFGDFLVPPISRAPTGDFQVPKNLGMVPEKKINLYVYLYTPYITIGIYWVPIPLFKGPPNRGVKVRVVDVPHFSPLTDPPRLKCCER